MTDLLTSLESLGFSPKKTSNTDGGEYTSACPACGDGGKGKKSDRFHIWPQKATKGLCSGRFWCRQCDISGDTISFLQKFHNMDFQRACVELGIVLPRTSGGRKRGYQPSASLPQSGPGWQPKEYRHPPAQWQEKAEKLLADCQARLHDKASEYQSYLEKRGITAEMSRLFGLGYNESSKGSDRYRPPSAWGLPDKPGKNGKPGKIWIPRGWVIPAYDGQGRIIQLRIRRLDEDIKRFAGNIKYFPISGSSMATMILYPSADVFVVVECGFDAMLIAGRMGGKIGAVTPWNVSAKPDKRVHKILSSSSFILNGLDYDKAGEKEQKWWNSTYPQNRRLKQPVQGVGDPGEAYGAGVDIKAWIIDSLPRGLQIKLGFIGRQKPAARPKTEHREKPAKTKESEKQRVIEITLSNGKIIYLTDDPAEWKSLSDQRKPVFTSKELARLKQATSTMNDEERLNAAMLAIDIKETIGGFIRRGTFFTDGNAQN